MLLVEAEPFSYRDQPLWAESALAVDVHGHTFTATLSDRQLAGHTQSMGDLRLTGTELAEDFSNRASFDTAAKQLVETLTSGGQVDQALALLKVRRGRLEAHVDDLLAGVNDFVYLGFGKALHDDEVLFRREGDGLDRVEPGFLKLLDVTIVNAFFF